MKRYTLLILDLLFMTANFTALTLFSSLKDFIAETHGLSEAELRWAASSFTIGIFFAFLIGHAKYVEFRPKLSILIAGLSVSIPQFLIPFTGNPFIIVILRVIQGLAMTAIPVFSYQAGIFYPRLRTLAIGIIVSGIFIGGLTGSIVCFEVAKYIGWIGTYLALGAVMITLTLTYIVIVPNEFMPQAPRYEVSVKAVEVLRQKFTIIWGFTFFPGLWVVFTLAPLIHFISEEVNIPGELASSVLEASYIFWSLASGLIAVLFKAHKLKGRNLFELIAKVQTLQYLIAVVGAITALMSRSPPTFYASLILIAAVQGTAPTFWSIPTIAYPKELASRAGYTLGLISNSSALIGPLVTTMISIMGAVNVILLTIALAITGALLTLYSIRLKMPIELT